MAQLTEQPELGKYINELIEENESLRLQIKVLKLKLDYDKYMFDMAWQLLLSYSQWYKIPKCLNEYFTSGETLGRSRLYEIMAYGYMAHAHIRQSVQSISLNEQRKERLVHAMKTFPPYETTRTGDYISIYAMYNREYPLRTLTPYADTDCVISVLDDSELDDSELEVIVD